MLNTDTGLQFIGDPYWGIGGRYVVDPQSGARAPAGEATAATQPSAASAPDTTPAETAPQEQMSQQSKEN
jgi:hypothetical protein